MKTRASIHSKSISVLPERPHSRKSSYHFAVLLSLGSQDQLLMNPTWHLPCLGPSRSSCRNPVVVSLLSPHPLYSNKTYSKKNFPGLKSDRYLLKEKPRALICFFFAPDNPHAKHTSCFCVQYCFHTIIISCSSNYSHEVKTGGRKRKVIPQSKYPSTDFCSTWAQVISLDWLDCTERTHTTGTFWARQFLSHVWCPVNT